MKVILLKDIARLGKKYDIKDVPDGHAYNYLIPRGLVETATKGKVKNIEKRTAHNEAEQGVLEEKFTLFLSEIKESPVTLEVSGNEKGHLFKGVREVDIAHSISERSGISVDPSTVTLARPIKEVGEHQVGVAVGEVTGMISLIVTAK